MRDTASWLFVIVILVLSSHATAAQGLERDLAYGADPNQRLDLSVPAIKGFATVLFVHGGSLTSGDKTDSDYRNVCAPFPAAGIACANVNYRLAPAHPWPAQAEDIAAAVDWVRANIESRGGDPRKLFLVGHSSGATLVAIVGTDERYLGRQGLKTSDLRGVVAMGSIMWDDDLEQALTRHGRGRVETAFGRDPDNRMYGSLDTYLDHWPIRHVRRGLPPFLFLIAESEQEQPPVLKTNRKFVEDARALGNSAEYKVLPGKTHYSAIRNLNTPGDVVFAIVRDFVRREPKIAFASKRNGHYQVYVMDADGRRQTQLTSSAFQNRFPIWSPDGKKIAFGSERAGKWELWVMNADGTSPVRLTGDIEAKAPRSWSPDGSRIIFESDRAGNSEIYSILADGTQLTNLTDNASDDRSPRWSPDGSRIAFASSRDGNAEIYVMRSDGSQQERLTNNPAADDGPVWSPDGTMIAFTSARDGNREIYSMEKNGRRQTRLTTDDARDDFALWSPDGTHIAFQAIRGENYDIEIMRRDGGQRTRVAASPQFDGQMSWSPDSRLLAFISSRDGFDGVYIARVDGRRTTRLTTQASLNPEWSR